MRYELQRGRRVGRDLDRIYDFLFESYVHFGDSAEDADARAAKRVEGIEAAMERLAARPRQGTRRDAMMIGLRSVTKERAIFYFNVDDDKRVVRVLAVFFGGQDHQRAMMMRMKPD
jgi:toxin ParE1/3/4